VPDSSKFTSVHTLHCLPGLEVLETNRSSLHFALRARAEYTIAFVKEGTERFVHRGKLVVALKGNFILINPNEAHRSEGTQQTRSYAAIYPSLPLLQELLPERLRLPSLMFREPVVRDDAARRKFSLFMDSAFSAHTPLGLQCLFLELMIEVLDKHASAAGSLNHVPKSSTAVTYVRDRLMAAPEETVTLRQLAEENGMSPLSLLRSFQRYLGCTPHVLQVSQRLRLAKILLRSGNSIIHTALACGFADQSHFTNTLRRWTGMTPAQYVRSIRSA